MIGGMVTATLLSLLVLPVIYGWVLQKQEQYAIKGERNEKNI